MMGQTALFVLFIVALVVGVFTYITPSPKPINPVEFMMENSGLNSVEVLNRKRIQKFNMTTNKGLVNMRGKMDALALEQRKLLDSIHDQQQVLNNAGKDITDILLAVQQKGEKSSKDILRLQALASEIKDEQRLLVAHGQQLIVLNNQLTRNRQTIADQISLANLNNETSLNTLQQRFLALKNQANSLFDMVTQRNQDVRVSMDKIKDQLNGLADNASRDSAVQQQSAKDRIRRMMDKEHEDMIKLADTQERSKDLLNDAQNNLTASKEVFNDRLQQTRDKIAEERQKAQDQAAINQQRAADQRMRIQDQRNR
jgi:hypothetical protein